MNYPKLEIYLNNAAELCIVKIERPNSSPEILVEMALKELMSGGIDEASLQLGQGVITSLKRWHPQEFDIESVISSAASALDEAGELAHRLIAKSVEYQTPVHIPSIEALLLTAAKHDPNAQIFFDDSWPVIRKRISSFVA